MAGDRRAAGHLARHGSIVCICSPFVSSDLPQPHLTRSPPETLCGVSLGARSAALTDLFGRLAFGTS